MELEKHCNRCVLRLDTVEHNEEGLCIYCQNHMQQEPTSWDHGKLEFVRDIGRYAGRGRGEFDILCPITGGKDSVFVLSCLRKLTPDARVLAFTWDHGVSRPQSYTNIKNAVEAARIPLVTAGLGRTMEETRRFLRVQQQTSGALCRLCGPAQSYLIYSAAVQYGVAAIVVGTTSGQNKVFTRKTGVMFSSDGGAPNQVRAKMRANNLAFVRSVFTYLFARACGSAASEIVDALVPAPSRIESLLCYPFPDLLTLGYYFDWNRAEEDVISMLKKEFGFEKPSGEMTHTSCELNAVRGYLEALHPSFTTKPGYMEFETAIVVREGALSREDGFRELQRHNVSKDPPIETLKRYGELIGLEPDAVAKNILKTLPRRAGGAVPLVEHRPPLSCSIGVSARYLLNRFRYGRSARRALRSC